MNFGSGGRHSKGLSTSLISFPEPNSRSPQISQDGSTTIPVQGSASRQKSTPPVLKNAKKSSSPPRVSKTKFPGIFDLPTPASTSFYISQSNLRATLSKLRANKSLLPPPNPPSTSKVHPGKIQGSPKKKVKPPPTAKTIISKLQEDNKSENLKRNVEPSMTLRPIMAIHDVSSSSSRSRSKSPDGRRRGPPSERMQVTRSEEERQRNPDRINLDNCDLSSFPLFAPAEHPQHLRLISLQHNRLTRLENLPTLTHLVCLDLYDNRIEKISGISGLVSLRVLLLGKNRIHRIEGLENIKRLEVLDLHGNQLRSVDNLGSSTSLRVLNLAGNSIRSVRNLGPLGLPSLAELNLKRNRIKNVEGLVKAPHLKKVLLGNNDFTSYGSLLTSLKKLLFLQELQLDPNPMMSGSSADQEVEDVIHRHQVLSVLPWLELLDKMEVTDVMRAEAKAWRRKKNAEEEERRREAEKVKTRSTPNLPTSREDVIHEARRRWESLKSFVRKSNGDSESNNLTGLPGGHEEFHEENGNEKKIQKISRKSEKISEKKLEKFAEKSVEIEKIEKFSEFRQSFEKFAKEYEKFSKNCENSDQKMEKMEQNFENPEKISENLVGDLKMGKNLESEEKFGEIPEKGVENDQNFQNDNFRTHAIKMEHFESDNKKIPPEIDAKMEKDTETLQKSNPFPNHYLPANQIKDNKMTMTQGHMEENDNNCHQPGNEDIILNNHLNPILSKPSSSVVSKIAVVRPLRRQSDIGEEEEEVEAPQTVINDNTQVIDEKNDASSSIPNLHELPKENSDDELFSRAQEPCHNFEGAEGIETEEDGKLPEYAVVNLLAVVPDVVLPDLEVSEKILSEKVPNAPKEVNYRVKGLRRSLSIDQDVSQVLKGTQPPKRPPLSKFRSASFDLNMSRDSSSPGSSSCSDGEDEDDSCSTMTASTITNSESYTPRRGRRNLFNSNRIRGRRPSGAQSSRAPNSKSVASPSTILIRRPMTGFPKGGGTGNQGERIGPGGRTLRRSESNINLTSEGPPAHLKKQGGDYLVEIEGKTLNIYGQGALKHTLMGFPTSATTSVTTIKFNYISYDSIIPYFGKLRQIYPSLEHIHFRANNLSTLAQLNALADFQGLTSLQVSKEGNTIVLNDLWTQYAFYRLTHWGLQSINGQEVGLLPMSKTFESLGYLALSCLPQSALTPLAKRLHTLKCFGCCSPSSSSDDSGGRKDGLEGVCGGWEDDPVLLDVIGKEALVYNPPPPPSTLENAISQPLTPRWTPPEAQNLFNTHRETPVQIIETGCQILEKLETLDSIWERSIQPDLVQEILMDFLFIDSYAKRELKKLKDMTLINKKYH